MIDPRWAWEPYRPTGPNPWDLRKAGHLYRRAAFGATWAELAGRRRRRAGQRRRQAAPRPGRRRVRRRTAKTMAASIGRFNNDGQLAAWWLYRLLYGQPAPAAREDDAVLAQPLRHQQRQGPQRRLHARPVRADAPARPGQLPRPAAGDVEDPAMMVWLDTSQSKKGKPNENYARELMELFSLGIGNYTEKDIREAARAFTGWEIEDGKARLQSRRSTTTARRPSSAGRATGKGEDIVRICLEQDSLPRISSAASCSLPGQRDDPADAGTARAAGRPVPQERLRLRGPGRDGAAVEPVLRPAGLSREGQVAGRFRPRHRPRPGRHAIGADAPWRRRLEGLGQNLFHPPSVKGWDGGPAWLNGQTLLFRQNLALAP